MEVELTQDRLKEVIRYSSDSGYFFWIKRNSNRIKVGDKAGHLRRDGYLDIKIDNNLYLSHRLACLYMTGKFPIDQMDHIDRVKINNKWSNLREVSNKENCRNQSTPKNSRSGITGVGWHKQSGTWRACIHLDGKKKHLGSFKNIEDAKKARMEANNRYGFHENHGR